MCFGFNEFGAKPLSCSRPVGESSDLGRPLSPEVPEDLGSIGFAGEEALYVAKGVAMSAYQDSGIALEFYKSYNPSFNNAKHYFDSLAALPIDEVQPCNMTGTMMTDPAFMNPYAQWTGDLDGLIEVDGGYHAYCPDGYFWIAPACRHNTSECIPVLSSRSKDAQ